MQGRKQEEWTKKDKQEKEANSQISQFGLDESDSKTSIKQRMIKTRIVRPFCVYLFSSLPERD